MRRSLLTSSKGLTPVFINHGTRVAAATSAGDETGTNYGNVFSVNTNKTAKALSVWTKGSWAGRLALWSVGSSSILAFIDQSTLLSAGYYEFPINVALTSGAQYMVTVSQAPVTGNIVTFSTTGSPDANTFVTVPSGHYTSANSTTFPSTFASNNYWLGLGNVLVA